MDTVNRLKDVAVSDRGFLFDPYSGATFTVNATGLAILRALQDGGGRDAVLAEVREIFELDEGDDPGRDLDEFVQQLRHHGLVPGDFRLESGP